MYVGKTMSNKFKQNLKNFMVLIPWIRTIYFKKLYHGVLMNQKMILGRIQHIGHSIDLRLSQDGNVPPILLAEMKFFLKKARSQGIAVDEASNWALGMWMTAKYRLQIENAKLPEPNNAEPLSQDFQALKKIIKERRSIRRWKEELINRANVLSLIEIAKWAPSSCNRQLWQVKILEKPKDIDFAAQYFPNNFFKSAPVILLIMANANAYGKNEKTYAYLDCGAFIQNLMLLLHVAGLGGCWIGFKGWDSLGNVHITQEKKKAFYDYFGFDPSLIPISMIAAGIPAGLPKVPPRQDLDSLLL